MPIKKEDKVIDLNDIIAEEHKGHRDLILYDGVCNMCHFWKNFIEKRDKDKVFRFVPLQTIVILVYSPSFL